MSAEAESSTSLLRQDSSLSDVGRCSVASVPELIPPSVAAHLQSIGVPRKLHKGQELFSQGDDSPSAFLVRAGNLRIVAATSSGRELLLAMKGPGELTGEVTCLLGTQRPASAIAEGEVELTIIGHDVFRQALKQHPELATAVLEEVSAQLLMAIERITARAWTDTTTRLAALLVRLCAEGGKHDGPQSDVELQISQEDLAAWIGATRESVTRSLSTLRDDGLVTTGRQRVLVHDLAGLEKVALS